MDRGVVVDLDGLDRPRLPRAAGAAARPGIDVMVKLASTEHGVVDVYAVGCSGDEDVPVMATACGEAAHPDREVAVRKALHEFAAARSRKAFMHGPLDLVRAATPPGYLDGWLDGHPPERLVEEDRALQAMLDWTPARARPPWSSCCRTPCCPRRSTVRARRPADRPPRTTCTAAPARRAVGATTCSSTCSRAQGDAVAAKVLVPGPRGRDDELRPGRGARRAPAARDGLTAGRRRPRRLGRGCT